MENPIKMDDLGGTTIFGNIHIYGIVWIIYGGGTGPPKAGAFI